MKSGFIVAIPIALLTGLVYWRYQVKEPDAAAGGMPGGAATGRPSAGGGQSGGRPGGGGGGGGMGMSRTPAVLVASVGPGRIDVTVETVGNIESPNKSQIAPRITGRIEEIFVREGDTVKAGDMLLRMDASELEGEVLQRESAVAEARARLSQAQLGAGPNTVGVSSQIEQQQASVTSAQADYKQVQNNYESNVASAKSLLTAAEADLRSANADVESAIAQLGRENANLENAKAKLKRAENLLAGGFISAQDAENARTQFSVSEAAVTVAKSVVQARREDVISAQARVKSVSEQHEIAKRKGTADIAASRARLTQAQAGLKLANANKIQPNAYRANLQALQSSLKSAEAQLQQSRSRRAETALRSPIAGVVTHRNADPGSLATPGAPVLTIQSIEWLQTRAAIPVEYGGKVRVGQEVKLTVDGHKEPFLGRITHFTAAADAASRQLGLLAKLDNSNGQLMPGMFGRLAIITDTVEATVMVPREAIRIERGESKITVIDDDMKAHVKTVKTGIQDGKNTQIIEGLAAGEKVVILAFDPLREGQQVMIPGARTRASSEPQPNSTRTRGTSP